MKIGIQNEGSVRTFWDGTILSIILDKINSLKGIEAFTNLSWLDLSDNKQLDSIEEIISL